MGWDMGRYDIEGLHSRCARMTGTMSRLTEKKVLGSAEAMGMSTSVVVDPRLRRDRGGLKLADVAPSTSILQTRDVRCDILSSDKRRRSSQGPLETAVQFLKPSEDSLAALH